MNGINCPRQVPHRVRASKKQAVQYTHHHHVPEVRLRLNDGVEVGNDGICAGVRATAIEVEIGCHSVQNVGRATNYVTVYRVTKVQKTKKEKCRPTEGSDAVTNGIHHGDEGRLLDRRNG